MMLTVNIPAYEVEEILRREVLKKFKDMKIGTGLPDYDESCESKIFVGYNFNISIEEASK